MFVATALATIALAAGGEAPFSGDLQPSVVVSSFTASAKQFGTRETLFWAAPDRFTVKPSQKGVGRTVERGGVRTVGRGRGFPGSRITGTFPARPDGFSESFRIPSNEYSLARARSGRRTFTSSRAGRRAALKTSFRLAANECAGLEAGRAELWVNRWTLMPLRYIERRGDRVLKTTIGYSRRNQAHPPGKFKQPRIGARAFPDSQGFVRTTPAEAAAELSSAPLLPTVLPKGFELTISGWAPRSGFTGPEASNPAYPELFAAVYRKGYERIDVTQRKSSEEWPSDPFGAECGFLFTSKATVNGNDAVFGTGPGFVPHLYWSDGELLHTLSGPYPKAELIAIAESLTPVSTG
ncbi:MAG: hypothetical protein ACR2OD_13230 [Gaiellaceae bacterium]